MGWGKDDKPKGKHEKGKGDSADITPSQGGAHRKPKPMQFQFTNKKDGTQDLREFVDESAAQAYFNKMNHIYVTFQKI